MKLVLLTGATGLLGRYLLRDLFAAGHAVAVIARGSRKDPAADRIETVMSRWEKLENRALPRPIILEGDLTQPGLGLSVEDRDLLRRHCRRVIHSAASLYFRAEENGEPQRTNLEGTRNVLELCEEVGVEQLHHLSTAYIAGTRTGRVYERELNVGQSFCNVYEESKCAAEGLVRRSSIPSITVYRPSIIVGDSQTGYTNTYHGFYAPYRITHLIATKLPLHEMDLTPLLTALGLQGDERKNFIPVDWVSRAVVKIFDRPHSHGETYHLSHPNPLPVSKLLDAGREVFGAAYQPSEMPIEVSLEELLPPFREQLSTYREYWRDDPVFDRTQIDAALPDDLPPPFDSSLANMLVRSSVADNFGWPPEKGTPADQRLKQLFRTNGFHGRDESPNNANQAVGLQITGRGGGWWHGQLQAGALTNVRPGVPVESAPLVRCSFPTLEAIGKQEMTADAALQSGRVVVLGTAIEPSSLAQVLGHLAKATL